MKEKILNGHSGCKVIKYIDDEDEDFSFVRKISRDINYNNRLINQCEKQKDFYSSYSDSPLIYDEGYIDDLFYFDMEYIEGKSLPDFIEVANEGDIKMISNFLIDTINENYLHDEDNSNAKNVISKKIKMLKEIIPDEFKTKNVRTSFKVLDNCEWKKISVSRCHGDFTTENIIFSDRGKFFLVDFQDSFYNTWVSDISKLFQDIIMGWMYRNREITPIIEQNMIDLSKSIIEKIGNDRILWYDIYCYLILDFLRIIPYIKDVNTFKFVDESIGNLVNRGSLYGHFNNTMCWPFYKISRG